MRPPLWASEAAYAAVPHLLSWEVDMAIVTEPGGKPPPLGHLEEVIDKLAEAPVLHPENVQALAAILARQSRREILVA